MMINSIKDRESNSFIFLEYYEKAVPENHDDELDLIKKKID